jgi:hypothetical protein
MNVKIRYTNRSHARVLATERGQYEWSDANERVCEVDVETAADLLTSPEEEWELAETPKPAVHRKLAELMGLAPKELILVPDETAESELLFRDEVNDNG